MANVTLGKQAYYGDKPIANSINLINALQLGVILKEKIILSEVYQLKRRFGIRREEKDSDPVQNSTEVNS